MNLNLRHCRMCLLAALMCLGASAFAQDKQSTEGQNENAAETASDSQPTDEEQSEAKAPEESNQGSADADDADPEQFESLDQIQADFSKQMRAYTKRYRAAPTKAEKAEVFKTMPKLVPYRDTLTRMIRNKPDSALAEQAITWWYRRGRSCLLYTSPSPRDRG